MTDLDVHLPVSAQPDIDTLVSYSSLAEAHGFGRVWLPESWGRDAVTTLTAIAEGTEEIGIGPSIVNVYSRSPALLGQTAATLQEAADGRFRLGLGPSGPAVIERWHGMDFENPLRRTREYVEIVSRVCSGEPVDYDGDLFSLSGFQLRCDPPEVPPPIDAAGMGPKAVELAGRFADGWHAVMLTPEGIRDRLEDYRRGRDLGDGGDPGRVTVSLPCCALADADRARELGRNHLAFYVGGMGTFYRDALKRQGYEDRADAIHDAWQAGDRAEATELVDEGLADNLVATGSPERARKILDRFREVDGVDAVAINFPRGASEAEVRETMENLAPA